MEPVSTPQKPKRPRRWLKRLAWSFTWLITLLVLAVVVLNWKGARAWKATVEEMNAKGDPVDLASVVPPLVPNEDNMAYAPIFARLFEPEAAEKKSDISQPSLLRISREPEVVTRNYPKSIGWRDGLPVDLASYQAHYWESAQMLKTNPEKTGLMSAAWKEHMSKDYWNGPQHSPAQDVLFALSTFEAELDELREACERPYTRFPHQYEKGYPEAYQHLKVMQHVARIASLKSSAELASQNESAALEDVFLSLRIADAAGNEPTLISYLVGISILGITYQPMWEGIVKHQWNDAQLASLETKLRSINLVQILHLAIRGDRNLGLVHFDVNKRNPQFFESWFGVSDQPDAPKWMVPLVSVIPQGWFDYNKVAIIRDWDKPLSCSDPAITRVFPERVAATALEANGKSRSRFMLPDLQSGLITQTNIKAAFNQDIIGLARIATALERHFLKHGSYPETLAGLDEAFSLKGGIPHDVATGNPPHYSRTSANRFVLYYDAWNGKDDGGITHMDKGRASNDYDQGDWVWPMPVE